MIYNNYKSIKENFDFNEVLNNDNIDDNNLIGNQLWLKNIVDNIKIILNQNYLISYIITYSLDKMSILIQYKNKSSNLPLSATKITINNLNIIFDIYNCSTFISDLTIETDINYIDVISNNNIQILKKLTQLFDIQKQNIEIGIVLTYYNGGKLSGNNSDLNNLPILEISGRLIKRDIMSFINIGYDNIIIKEVYNNTIDDYTFHEKYLNCDTIFNPLKYDNISIYDIDLSVNINKDIKNFIKYAKKYLIPSNGHILFLRDTDNIENYEIYWKNLSLCKFTDSETKIKIKNIIPVQITNKDIEIIYNKIKKSKYSSAYTYNISDTLKNIKENRSAHFYIRIVLACIFGMHISILSTVKQDLLWCNKNIQYDSILIKAYFNYIIDDINNKGDIYKQIKQLIN